MGRRPHNVLFLCTGNSARSILAEALINYWGRGRFRGFSAGSHPKGTVHPLALECLEQMGLPTEALRSKSWNEFAESKAPRLDLIITVCDNAAGEVCPYWPGHPLTAHWGIPDPASVEGSEAERRMAFRTAYEVLEERIKLLMGLALNLRDRARLQERLRAIGRIDPRSGNPNDTPPGREREYLRDVRDGLSRRERTVLYVLDETQKERGDRNVPTAMLWGRVCEHFYISPEELSEMLARLGARR
jgi:arsenate reductase (thioredoxin)